MWNTIHESRATASKKDNIVVRRLWVAQSGGGGRGGRRKARDTEGEGCGLLDLNQLFYKIYVWHNFGQRYYILFSVVWLKIIKTLVVAMSTKSSLVTNVNHTTKTLVFWPWRSIG